MAAEIVGDINNDENNVNEKWKMTWGVKHGWLFKKKNLTWQVPFYFSMWSSPPMIFTIKENIYVNEPKGWL